MANKTLKIGMIGCGTVGGGVYNLIAQKQDYFNTLGLQIQISKICVRDATKPRDDVAIDLSKTTFVTSYMDILKDSSINCVLELMGGVEDAKDIVFQAIEQGKHVITANKALIANHLPTLTKLLEQNPQVKFGYESSVGGGIPIIHAMQDAFVGDNVTQVLGIMNGTTNYMLSKMEHDGVAYADVLAEAQRLGFAEANPSADVDGFDVQSKIAILAKLAYGCTVDPNQVPTMGVTRITQADFEYAQMMKSTVKLLGVAERLPNTESVSVYVSPVVVHEDNVLAKINGATNIVNVRSESLESSSFVGQGAGRYPTANSVLSDILQIARGLTPAPFPAESNIKLEMDYEARFYVRIKVADQVGIVRAVGEEAEAAGVSIYSMLQSPIIDPSNVDFVITTDKAHLSSVQKMSQAIAKKPFTLEEPLCLPILD